MNTRWEAAGRKRLESHGVCVQLPSWLLLPTGGPLLAHVQGEDPDGSGKLFPSEGGSFAVFLQAELGAAC